MIGGRGRDALVGGEGADRFVFVAGRDVIADFEPGDDDLDLSRVPGVSSFADVRAAATQQGSDLLLRFDTGVVLLRDMRLSRLDSDDLIL
jgi:Ca2+-binding RTX toxin-like protein